MTVPAPGTLKNLFHAKICTQSLDLEKDITVYTPQAHKGVRCRYCETNHVVNKTNWDEFLNAARSSPVTDQERNQFIHEGLSSGVLRASLTETIQNHPAWEETLVWFAQQKTMIAEFEAAVENNSSHTLTTNQLQVLKKIHIPGTAEPVYIKAEQLQSFLHNLTLKKETSHLKKTLPSIVYSHFETLMGKTVAEYTEELKIQPGLSSDVLVDIFFRRLTLKENQLDAQEMKRFLPSHNMAYRLPGSDRLIMVLKPDALALATEVSEMTEKQNRTSFFKALAHHEVDVFEYCLPYMQTRPGWDEAVTIMSEVTTIHEKFRKEVCEQNLDSSSEASRYLFCRDHLNGAKRKHHVTEDTYNRYVHDIMEADTSSNLLTPDFVVTYNMVKRHILRQTHQMLVELNKKMILRKEEESKEQYEPEHLVPVSHLTQQQLVEFYVCGRKNRYNSKEEAWVAAVVFNAKPESSFYLCGYCSGWHYGVKALRDTSHQELVAGGKEWYLQQIPQANRFMRKDMN